MFLLSVSQHTFLAMPKNPHLPGQIKFSTAQYKDNRWIDKGSNISQSKEDYFLNVSAEKIKQLQDEKSKSMNSDSSNNQRRRQRRR